MIVTKFSKIGIHHLETNTDNQDVILSARRGGRQVIVLADGVSTCRNAAKGAAVAAAAAADLFIKKGSFFLNCGTDQAQDLLLSHVLYNLTRTAEAEQNALDEYASTLAGVFVDIGRKEAVCFSLGDSIVLSTCEGKAEILCLPADSRAGCPVTVTKDAKRFLTVKKTDVRHRDAFLVCSDGAWRLLFDRNALLPETDALLTAGDFEGLKRFLSQKENFDDCSFIAADLKKKGNRSS